MKGPENSFASGIGLSGSENKKTDSPEKPPGENSASEEKPAALEKETEEPLQKLKLFLQSAIDSENVNFKDYLEVEKAAFSQIIGKDTTNSKESYLKTLEEVNFFQTNTVNAIQQIILNPSETLYSQELKESCSAFLMDYLHRSNKSEHILSKIEREDISQKIPYTLVRAHNNNLNIDTQKASDICLEVLDRTLVELEKKDSASSYAKIEGLINIFSLEANSAAGELLERLKKADIPEKKQLLGNILYRLELGKINISENGVNYLNKTYDLQEFNNPEYFANRLTAKGDIGVFDENNILQKHFNIGDLSSDESTIRPAVFDFAYETLFIPKENETPEEREEREKYLQEFKANYFGFYNEEFHQKTGVRFNNLDFKEQGWFMLYHKHADPEKQEELMQFIATHGENGLKTFLSLEQDKKMGEKILQIDNELADPELANHLFAQYASMVDMIEKNLSKIKDTYSDVIYGAQLDENEIRRTLLSRATNLLKDVSNKINTTESKEQLVLITIANLQEEAEAKQKNINNLKEVANKINEELFNLSVLAYATEDYLYDTYNGTVAREDVSEEIASVRDYFVDGVNLSDFLRKDLERYKKNFLADFGNDFVIDGKIDFKKSIAYARGVRSENLNQEIKKILTFRKNLERKMKDLIFDIENVSVTEQERADIKKEIQFFKKELQDGISYYMPVGVSSKLPEEDEVHIKSIDALGYMFWLQNQETPIDFIVVDTIQKSNYQVLYNLDEKIAIDKSKINGARDYEWYKKIIDVFELKQINMRDYSQIKDSGKIHDSMALINNVTEESPILKNAFATLVQKSIYNKTNNDNANTLLEQYGKEEIAFILAEDKHKIGHEKEYRYDILARIVPIYNALRNNIDKIDKLHGQSKEEQDSALVEMSLYLGLYREYPDSYHYKTYLFNAKKERNIKKEQEKSAKTQEQKESYTRERKNLTYLIETLEGKINNSSPKQKKQIEITKLKNKTIKALGLSKNLPEVIMIEWGDICESIQKEEWLQELQLPQFYYPKNVTAMSFEMQKDEQEEFMGFKEFYSTEKGRNQETLSIDANQVVASTSPMAAAKLMLLSEEKQKQYFKKVLKPLLVNFYIATSINKDEAVQKFEQDAKNMTTIAEVIKLVQDKIIQPMEQTSLSE